LAWSWLDALFGTRFDAFWIFRGVGFFVSMSDDSSFPCPIVYLTICSWATFALIRIFICDITTISCVTFQCLFRDLWCQLTSIFLVRHFLILKWLHRPFCDVIWCRCFSCVIIWSWNDCIDLFVTSFDVDASRASLSYLEMTR
jgi:hypothetical protein